MTKDHGPQIKNDKKYEELREDGMSQEKAARISNTKNASKKGGKASNYEDRTKKELMEEAKKVGVQGRSSMDKQELIDALRSSN